MSQNELNMSQNDSKWDKYESKWFKMRHFYWFWHTVSPPVLDFGLVCHSNSV